jgi:hypothetical protein
MKTLLITCKALALTLLGLLGCFSMMLFPFLIGSNDSQTAIIGYSYLGVLLLSIALMYLLVKKELKQA